MEEAVRIIGISLFYVKSGTEEKTSGFRQSRGIRVGNGEPLTQTAKKSTFPFQPDIRKLIMTINVNEYADRLLGLYQKQLASSNRSYLKAHAATRGGVLRQVQAARLYLPYVTGRVLDWGCFHAPDACLVRMFRGDEVELYGCDVHSPDLDCFPIFHQEAELRYQQLTHSYNLPYEDDFFDTIIADGVLEHAPNDYESIKELYRILKPDGVLIVSCLPNTYSYLEALTR